MNPTVEKLIAEIDQIYVAPESRDDAVTERVTRHFPPEKIHWHTLPPSRGKKGMMNTEEFDSSKRQLLLTRFKGQFFKRCPGATQKRALTCCNYFVLNLGLQCNMNCSYCYLQSYLNHPVMTIYTNGDQAIEELDNMARQYPDHPYRVGTGEVIDSLSLDPLTLYSQDLIRFAAQYPKWIVEFKTKSDSVDQFISEQHAGNVVVSWSINPPAVINSEEHKTARYEERLAAAEKCVAAGFPVAFHIDPMIEHDGWRENYSQVVDDITTRFSPEQVHVISVGSLRFQPEQKAMMRRRFGAQSLVVRAEMFPSDGGKMRYDQGIRSEMNRHVIERFRQAGPGWKTFICMETPENWIKSYDSLPVHSSDIRPFFQPLPKIKPAVSVDKI